VNAYDDVRVLSHTRFKRLRTIMQLQIISRRKQKSTETALILTCNYHHRRHTSKLANTNLNFCWLIAVVAVTFKSDETSFLTKGAMSTCITTTKMDGHTTKLHIGLR
jgi:hypothetical protein